MQPKPPPQSAQRAGRTDGAAGETDGSSDPMAAELVAGEPEGVVDVADAAALAGGSAGPQAETITTDRRKASGIPDRPGLDTRAG